MTGRPLERVVRDRIFRPLSLWDSGYGTPAAVRPSARRTPGWLGAPEDASAPVNGADGIVSTTSDLARFFGALLRGELLERDLQSELTRTVEADAEFRAGLGLFRAELPCGAASGHGGDEPAYSNQVFASGDGSKIVVVAQNTSGWDRAKKTAEAMFCAGD